MNFHERAKAFRKDILQVNQGELARLIGLSQSRLSNYENGRRQYPKDVLVDIANIAGLSYYEFMQYIDPEHEHHKRLNYLEQIQLAKESNQHLLADFIEKYENLFSTSSIVRDHIALIEKLPINKRTLYLQDQRKILLKLIKDQE